jgi:molybdate transport system substrate-binding protein
LRRRTRIATALLLAPLCGVAVLACGAGRPRLEVTAAVSLRRAFTRYATSFSAADVSFSFAASDVDAAQIRQGARPDVFASANTELPDALHAEGLAEQPVVFAANRLVLAVASGSHLRALGDAARAGVTIAFGTPTSPVGIYADSAIARLAPAQRFAMLANVRDREPNVTDIVGKLLAGAVDAGFIYASDVAATGGRLRAIQLPASLQPRVSYAVVVVKGTHHEQQARAFVAGLLAAPGRAALLAAGFEAPGGSGGP